MSSTRAFEPLDVKLVQEYRQVATKRIIFIFRSIGEGGQAVNQMASFQQLPLCLHAWPTTCDRPVAEGIALGSVLLCWCTGCCGFRESRCRVRDGDEARSAATGTPRSKRKLNMGSLQTSTVTTITSSVCLRYGNAVLARHHLEVMINAVAL